MTVPPSLRPPPRIRREVLLLFLAFGFVFGTVLLLQPSPTPSLSAVLPAQASPDDSRPAPAPVAFREVSLEWNVAVAHEQSSDPLSSLSETLGGGVCVIDFDRDGFMDLFHVGGRGHTRQYGRQSWWRQSRGNRLLHNRAGRSFEDVTERAGLETAMWGMGCAVGDLDNDGYADLIVTGVGGNRVYRNRGGDRFEDVTTAAGVANDHWSTGASLADFDGDGLLDVYVSNFALYEKGARTFERMSGFRSTADIAFDHTLYDPEPNRLYKNLGGFRFADVAAKLGVANALGRSLGARFADVNGDRWPDLLVVNARETPNQFFVNRAGGGFARQKRPYEPFELGGSHDAVLADFDNDGSDELFMTRGRGSPSVLLAYSPRAGRYVDAAWERGLAGARQLAFAGWAAVPADLNNDGFVDLYIANGGVLPDADARFVPQAQANTLLLNDGAGRFDPYPATTDPERPYSSRGAVAVDLDNDGRLELVVANNNDALQIFASESREAAGNWLALDFGEQPDARVYGARITARAQGLMVTHRVEAPQRFLSQGDPRVHLGLGGATRIEELRIVWRDGGTSVFENVVANRYVRVDRAAGELVASPAAGRRGAARGGGLAARSGDSLLGLARILLAAGPAERNDDDLIALFGAAPPEVRRAVLGQLSLPFGPRRLSLVKRALSDPTAEVRLQAVASLRKAELERSVSWLLALLDDPEVSVQCAVAQTFRVFFDEEEAVTQRKALALSPLLKLLARGAPEAKTCAADALAAAENKRAVLPLIELARSTAAGPVRVAAIRALGLIRDTRGRDVLRAIVDDEGSGGAVLGASLVALSRLDEPELAASLARVFELAAGEDERARLARRLDALAYLLDVPDGSVFGKASLLAYVTKLGSRARRLLSPRQAPEGLARAVLRALAAARARQLEPLAASLATSDNPTVRTEALVALAALDTRSATARLEARLPAEPAPVVESVVQRLIEDKLGVSAATIVDLFEREETSGLALRLLEHAPRPAADAALARLMQEARSDDEALALLETCAKASLVLPAIDPRYADHPSPALRARYVACLLHGARARSTGASETPELLRARTAAVAMATDPALDETARLDVLLAAAQHDPVIARTTLLKRLEKLPADRLPAALRALSGSGTAPDARDFLWALLKDPRRPSALRVQAAELLAATDRAALSQRLYSELARHEKPEKPASK